MIKSKVLGKSYKTMSGYQTQIGIFQEKMKGKVDRIEIEINQESDPDKRLSLQSERSAILKRVQSAVDESQTIEDVVDENNPGEES